MPPYLDPSRIAAVMESLSYSVRRDRRGHDLNIVGIRTRDNVANTFNDWVTVFYLLGAQWNFFAFPATTDPGAYYRRAPLNVKGTAVLKPGQYPGAYRLGRHRNYKALQQYRPVTIYRDDNRDERNDTTGLTEESGLFGINIHHANAHRASMVVGRWSAGCQVLQDPEHFAFFMALCERARDQGAKDFTYTLLTEDQLGADAVTGPRRRSPDADSRRSRPH